MFKFHVCCQLFYIRGKKGLIKTWTELLLNEQMLLMSKVIKNKEQKQ